MYENPTLDFRILFCNRNQEAQFNIKNSKFVYYSLTTLDNVWGFIVIVIQK